MDRRTRTLFAVLLVVILLTTGIAAILIGAPSPPEPDVPTGATEVTGVVVGVDAEDLGDVRGFSLRTDGGEVLDFTLGPLENPEKFPPGHLAEHHATAEPVRVWYRMDGADRVVVKVEDATD